VRRFVDQLQRPYRSMVSATSTSNACGTGYREYRSNASTTDSASCPAARAFHSPSGVSRYVCTCSGERSSSANGAIAIRHSSASGWSTSSSKVLSDWTISGPSVTNRFLPVRGPELSRPSSLPRCTTCGKRRSSRRNHAAAVGVCVVGGESPRRRLQSSRRDGRVPGLGPAPPVVGLSATPDPGPQRGRTRPPRRSVQGPFHRAGSGPRLELGLAEGAS
jgi:hypothetical protein